MHNHAARSRFGRIAGSQEQGQKRNPALHGCAPGISIVPGGQTIAARGTLDAAQIVRADDVSWRQEDARCENRL
jgi:hypothetical protein